MQLSTIMKEYEYKTRLHLEEKTPVIIRLDGYHFHIFTRGFKKPFDDYLSSTMQETMLYLCENIQGCILGYTQSDEISLLLEDTCENWFNYNLQKIISISSSMCTLKFNQIFSEKIFNSGEPTNSSYYQKKSSLIKNGFFDSRAFNIPKSEVANYFIFRQQDCIRNSIQSLASSKYNQKQINNINCDNLKCKLIEDYNIDWNELPIYLQRGTCCIKYLNKEKQKIKWKLDENIPIFSKNKSYIDNILND